MKYRLIFGNVFTAPCSVACPPSKCMLQARRDASSETHARTHFSTRCKMYCDYASLPPQPLRNGCLLIVVEHAKSSRRQTSAVCARNCLNVRTRTQRLHDFHTSQQSARHSQIYKLPASTAERQYDKVNSTAPSRVWQYRKCTLALGRVRRVSGEGAKV